MGEGKTGVAAQKLAQNRKNSETIDIVGKSRGKM